MFGVKSDLFAYVRSSLSEWGDVTYIKQKNECEINIRIIFTKKNFEFKDIWDLGKDLGWHVGGWNSEGGKTFMVKFVCANCDLCCD